MMAKKGRKIFSKPIAVVLAFLLMLSTLQVPILAAEYLSELPEYNADGKIIAFDALAEEVAEQTVPFGTELEQLTLPTELFATFKITTTAAISITGVEWESYPAFDPYAMGQYEFTAVLPNEYVLADDIFPPRISVFVQPLAFAPMSATHNLPMGGEFLAPIEPATVPSGFIRISTEAELRNIMDNFAGLNWNDTLNFYLANDIDLQDPWEPIELFRGTFDGRGNVIRNLYNTELNRLRFGLFGEIRYGATIKNLGVYFPPNGLEFPLGTNNQNVGGLVASWAAMGDGNYLTIHNSYVIGDITVHRSGSAIIAGGLIGENNNTLAFPSNAERGPVAITYSYAVGNIYVNSTAPTTIATTSILSVSAGGLIGASSNGTTSIQSSYSIGDVTVVYIAEDSFDYPNIVSRGSFAGGLIGHSIGTTNLHRVFSAGDVSAYRNAVLSHLFAGSLVAGSSAGTFEANITESYRCSDKQVIVNRGTNAFMQGYPSSNFGLMDLMGVLSFTVPDRTSIPNINVHGHVVRRVLDVNFVTLSVGTNNPVTVPVNSDGTFRATLILDGAGVHDITVTASYGGHVASATRQVDFDPQHGVEISRFWVSGRGNTNLLRQGIPDLIVYTPGTTFTFEVVLDVPVGTVVSEVNLTTANNTVFTMTPTCPLGNRWVFVDRNVQIATYLPNINPVLMVPYTGAIDVEVIWTHGEDYSTDSIIQTITGASAVAGRYRNSLLMPNTVVSPAIVTNAYVLHPSDEPSGGTVIRPNSGNHVLASGFTLYTAGGNLPWYIDVTSEAIGKTFVFWGHANNGSEVIFATINEAGRFPIGNARGMNAFYFYGYWESYAVISKNFRGHYRFIIDPSGYVYEAVLSNRLQGVTATIFREGTNTPWNAADYEQENPLLTDEIGHYAWDVPAGDWFVQFYKTGFEPAQSITMPVPPEHTEVHIGLISRAVPNVTRVNGFPTGIEVLFNRFMCAETLTTENFTVMQGGVEVSGELILINRESNFLSLDYLHGTINQATGFPNAREDVRHFATIVRFVPDNDLVLGSAVQITVSGDVESYADVSMGSDFVTTVTIEAEPTNLTAENLRLDFDESGNITVSAYPLNAVVGRTITAVSNNPYIAEVTTASATIDASGNAVIAVDGLLSGSATITIHLVDTRLSTSAAVVVGMPLDIRLSLDYTLDMLGIVYEAPHITSVNSHTVAESVFDTFQVTATGNPAPMFRLADAPAGVTIDPASGQIRIEGIVAVGVHPFTVFATNDEGYDSELFTLTIAPIENDNDCGYLNCNCIDCDGNNCDCENNDCRYIDCDPDDCNCHDCECHDNNVCDYINCDCNNCNGSNCDCQGNDDCNYSDCDCEDCDSDNCDCHDDNNNDNDCDYSDCDCEDCNGNDCECDDDNNNDNDCGYSNCDCNDCNGDDCECDDNGTGNNNNNQGGGGSGGTGGGGGTGGAGAGSGASGGGNNIPSATPAPTPTPPTQQPETEEPTPTVPENDEQETPATPVPTDTPIFANPFADVSANAWYHDAVVFVYSRGLMSGTHTNPMQFSPNAPLTRGMVVTVLHRYLGSPNANTANPFSDIANETWYTDAVRWAAENNIVSGFGDGRFGASDNITRQDMAVILARFADFAEMQLPQTRNPVTFNDNANIAPYATQAVETLFRAEVINGRPNNVFDPTGNASRAEFAAMLMNFLTLQ